MNGSVKAIYKNLVSLTLKNGGRGRPWGWRSAKKASLSRSIRSLMAAMESSFSFGRRLKDGKLLSWRPDILENRDLLQLCEIRPNNFQKVHNILESSRSYVMKIFITVTTRQKRVGPTLLGNNTTHQLAHKDLDKIEPIRFISAVLATLVLRD